MTNGKIVVEPEHVYHANKEFISATPLKSFKLSAKHFLKEWKDSDFDGNQAADNGTFIHSLVLEQDINKFVPRPVKEDGSLVRSNSNEYKAFEEANKDKTIVAPELFKMANEVLTSFVSSKSAMDLYNKAKIEHSIYANDPETGLPIKARVDIWGDGYIADVKTTGKNLDDFFSNTIWNSQWDLQLAHYAQTILAATGEVIERFFIIAIEQNDPFGIRVYEIPKVYIDEMTELRRRYLNQIFVAQQDKVFPSYDDVVIPVIRPEYMKTIGEIIF